ISLDRFAEEGGLAAHVLLDLLAFGNGNGATFRFYARNRGLRSVMGEIQIVSAGTREYAEALRELNSEASTLRTRDGRIVFGPGGVSGNGQSAGRNSR